MGFGLKVKAPTVKVGGHFKLGGTAKAGGKVHIKLGGGFKLKAKAGYKVISGFENKTSPKLFLKGTTCKASFDKAYTSLYAVNHERKVVQAYGKKCFMALVRIRGELSCAVCDNKMEKFFADPSKMSIKEGDLNHLGVCVQFMAKFNTYKSLLSDMLSFAKSMGIKTDAQEDKLAAINFAMDTSCASEAPAAPAKKDDKKPVTPAKKDDKKADKSGTSTGFLPALPVAKKDDKKDAKPAAKKDDKKAAPAKKNRILQAPVKKEEKKPVTPAKKDDKKPVTPAKKDDKKDEKKDDKKDEKKDDKKDDKKPVTPAKKADSTAWSMDTKIGEVTAWTNWK